VIIGPYPTPFHATVGASLAELEATRAISHVLIHPSDIAPLLKTTDSLGIIPRRLAGSELVGMNYWTIPLELPPLEFVMSWPRRCEYDPAQRWLRGTILQIAKSL